MENEEEDKNRLEKGIALLLSYLSLDKIRTLIKEIKISGLSVKDTVDASRKTNEVRLKELWKKSVMADVDAATFQNSLSALIKSRKRSTLGNLRNVFSGVRGSVRGFVNSFRKGLWHNRGIFDSAQTHVCAGYLGWVSKTDKYSDIPLVDRPPRTSTVYHPCRSWLDFIPEGSELPNEQKFITQFNNANTKQQQDILGKTRFEAYKAGTLKIESIRDYERSVLHTIEELGLN